MPKSCEARWGYPKNIGLVRGECGLDNVVDIFNKLEKRLRGSLWKTIMTVRQKNIVKRGLW